MNAPIPRLPATRGDCVNGPRPCQHITCRHNLTVDHYAGGAIHVRFGNGETCSLDVADRGEHTLQEVADVMGITREAVRKIEGEALRKTARELFRLRRGKER